MEKLVRKKIVTAGKIFIGLGLIIFLIFYVEPEKILSTLLQANKIWLLIPVLLLPVNLYLQYYKWRILSDEYFRIKDNSKTWLSLFYGISGGIFTPMKSGEYFARALPYQNVKVFDVILATIVDKLIPIFFVVLIGGMVFIIYLKSLLGFSLLTTIALILLYKILILLPLYFLLGNSKSSIKLRDWLRSKKYFEKIINRVSFLKKLDGKTINKIILVSFFYHITFTSQMTFLLIAYSGEFNFVLFFFAANLIIFAQIVIPPIALGEVGVREGAAVYFLQNLGYTSAIGFNAAISLFFINLLVPSIVGLVLLLKRG